mgnify:CR=1 FL=1
MGVFLKYGDKIILSYDTDFDPGFGHFMMVLGILLDTIKKECPDEAWISVYYVKK